MNKWLFSGPFRQNSQCTDDEFACGDSDAVQCVSAEWVCDGRRDCNSGADERNCGEMMCSVVIILLSGTGFIARSKQANNYCPVPPVGCYCLNSAESVLLKYWVRLHGGASNTGPIMRKYY